MLVAIKFLGGFGIFFLLVELLGAFMILIKKEDNIFAQIIIRSKNGKKVEGFLGIIFFKILVGFFMLGLSFYFYLSKQNLASLICLGIFHLAHAGFEKIFAELNNF
ncbi:hypothetical protein LV469_06555 [Peptoniphilus sp. GNH]|nr:hypothetical protein HMPREF3189_00615 [Clostridiales bacterium KA00134]UHR02302.1 hypothetical protein LV469_06555 [Peptoniphilus sp. GNH]